MTYGDEGEFTEMVQRQSRFAFRVAYAVLLNAYDAEDAVQETFLKLYRNGGWRGVDHERAFLARATWRVAVDRLPHGTRTSGKKTDAEALPAVPSQRPGPELSLMAANQHAVVHGLINELPEDLRVPLVLSAEEELNSREIGVILGIPEGTVRTRLQRARQILRGRMERLDRRSGKPTSRLTPNQETQNA